MDTLFRANLSDKNASGAFSTTSRRPVAIFSQFGFTGNGECGRKSLLMSIQRGRQSSQEILCHIRDLILHM
jgi:hypothetical protein